MPPLSVLIKPASSNCNLSCRYCFYHSIAENRETSSFGFLKIDDLEEIVRKALAFAEISCTFAFQGGEPTLAGLDFYRKLIEFQKEYNFKKVKIANAIQTNGVSIDQEWSKFLAENNFLVGISLDGPKDIHDVNRINHNNKGSFNQVMSAINLFEKYKVEYNVLSVVNSLVARHISKVYGFFKKNNFKYLQFIPCLDPLNEVPGNYNYSLKPDRYAFFLKELFDLWFKDIMSGNIISIRYFDNLVSLCMGYRSEACGMSGQCQCQFVIEANGGVYPCDFYANDQWHLGNIFENGFEQLVNGEKGQRFIEESKYIDVKCRECNWLRLCRGGCRRSREPFNDGKPVLNYYCEAYKEFFKYSYDRLQYLANVFSNRF